MVNDPNFGKLYLKIITAITQGFARNGHVMIVLICRSGRHRSVGSAELLKEVLYEYHHWYQAGGVTLSTRHLCQNRWTKGCSANCDSCRWTNASDEAVVRRCVQKVIQMDALDYAEVHTRPSVAFKCLVPNGGWKQQLA